MPRLPSYQRVTLSGHCGVIPAKETAPHVPSLLRRGWGGLRDLSFVMCHLSLLTLALPARAQNIGGTILDNLLQTGGASGLGRTGDRPLPQVVGSVISVALTLLGIIFLVLIVYGGFVWLLARGREEEVQKAQKVIETSVIGLIVIILAFAISKFIFATIIKGAGV